MENKELIKEMDKRDELKNDEPSDKQVDESTVNDRQADSSSSSTDNQPKDKSLNEPNEDESANDSQDATANKHESAESQPQLTEQEIKERLERSIKLKDDGNVHFKSEEFERSLELYDEALDALNGCPDVKEARSIILNNKAACKWKLLERSNQTNLDFKDEKLRTEFDEIINTLNQSIDLNPVYFKPYLKRAELNHRFGDDKLDSSLEDYKKLLELVPSDNRRLLNEIKHEICKLDKEIELRNEKLKQEMFSKLKDLGNLCLRPFGLSTDNFKLQQNENGGYSVNFQQQ